MTGPDERFLARWSRLKQQERDSDLAPASPDPSDSPADLTDAPVAGSGATPGDAQDGAGQADDPLADLPDIETLDKDSDFTGFMRDGVPEELRNRALRKLWLSDPVFANLDGLNDYDHDYATLLQEGTAALKRLADAVDAMAGKDTGEGTAPAAPPAPDTAEADEQEAMADAKEEPLPPGGTGNPESRENKDVSS